LRAVQREGRMGEVERLRHHGRINDLVEMGLKSRDFRSEASREEQNPRLFRIDPGERFGHLLAIRLVVGSGVDSLPSPDPR
jgi:hypothetical protein